MNEFIAAFATFLAAAIIGLWYNRLLKRERPSFANVIHNLPAPSSQLFVDRANAIEQLRKFLSPSEPNTIAGVFGMAGIGKTALLIEIGRDSVRSNSFELVMYIPARHFSLSDDQAKSNSVLDTIISTAIYSLDSQQIKRSNSEKEAFVRTSFSQKRTLLLIDGLDEMGEREQKELLGFLSSLPSQTKAIVSSRHKINLAVMVQLNALTFDEYRTLLSKELIATKTAELSDDLIEKLYHLTGGLPLAVKWVAALLRDYSIDTVLNQFEESDNTLFEFVIEPVISRYRNKYPYNKILITMAHMPNLATLPEIADEAGLADDIQAVEEGLVTLTRASLLTKRDDKYEMHPLTKVYVLSRQRF